MPTVLRLVYSRFAAQEMLADKLGEPEERAPLPVDGEHAQETALEMGTDPQTDQLINKPTVEV